MMIAFWTPGEIKHSGRSIAVDRPCLLMLRDQTLTISNPQNQPATVNAQVDGRTITINLPAGPSAGSSASQIVKN